jgi:type II secretory pathway predicted ATPase ExeA
MDSVEGRRPLLELFPPSAPPAGQAAHAPQSDTTGYETFYGLNEQPFSLSTDPKFIFHSGAHDNVAQQLLSAIGRREPVVVISGEVGLGKTMLCRAVMEELDRRTLTSYIKCPIGSPEELLKTMLRDFGLVGEDRARVERASRHDLVAALREFLATLVPLEAFAVVLVDDAHGLSGELIEQIRLLVELTEAPRLLQIVLIGQPALAGRLRASDVGTLDERVAVRCALKPLAREEIPDYVSHRLSMAGANPRVGFSDAAGECLHRISGGVPTVVNLLCDRALALGFVAGATLIDDDLIEAAAQDLDLYTPEPIGRWLLRDAVLIVAFAALVLVGALAAARVFHEPLSRLIVRWGQTR